MRGVEIRQYIVPKTGPAKGLVNGIDKMRPEYYKVRGWTPEGVPTKETLARLGL